MTMLNETMRKKWDIEEKACKRGDDEENSKMTRESMMVGGANSRGKVVLRSKSTKQCKRGVTRCKQWLILLPLPPACQPIPAMPSSPPSPPLPTITAATSCQCRATLSTASHIHTYCTDQGSRSGTHQSQTRCRPINPSRSEQIQNPTKAGNSSHICSAWSVKS